MQKTASLDSTDFSDVSQVKLDKLQVNPTETNFCAEFLDSINAHANYRYILVGVESKKAEMMVSYD
jgi:hypothetical protein